MWSTRKRRRGSRLGQDKRDIPAFDTVLLHSNLGSVRRNYLNIITTDINVLTFGSKASKRLLKIHHRCLKNNESKVDFRFVEENFLQPLTSPEARKKRSCQSFSVSHIGPRADCLFHRPAFFRPVVISRTRPRAILLAVFSMKKAIHGFLWIWGSAWGIFGPSELSYYIEMA